MRLFLTLFSLAILSQGSLTGQTAPDFWQPVAIEEMALPSHAKRLYTPKEYTAFSLQFEEMSQYLTHAPREFSSAARKQSFQIVLPLADGQKEVFSVAKTRVMDARLEAEHPEIGTYSGESLDHPGTQVRITITPTWGFNAFFTRVDKGIEYLEPVAVGQHSLYMAYDRIHFPRNPEMANARLSVEIPPSDDEAVLEFSQYRFSPGDPGPEDGEPLGGEPVGLKVFRFALAATGEFSQDNGGTKDAVFQKLTTYVGQLNAIYERDLNIRLNMIAESYDIIFLDPNTDPYTASDVGGWMSQNPVIMVQALGTPDKYDIGHVFARYPPNTDTYGVAGGLCCTDFKGRGCSSAPPPYGDDFFFVASQEIGHQWAGGHTFNQCFDGAQFNYESACEPGSGSTIMSYSGLCKTQTYDNNVNGEGLGVGFLYYHACSIAEIRRFYQFQEGAGCGSILPTNNTSPEVSTNYPPVTFIPISTPFELTGTATDIDGDAITYSWDEIDLGPTTRLGQPIGNSPLFRWYEPSTSPTRIFPKIQNIITNISSITEVLPTYSRDITFVLVARDNKASGGGVAWDTVELRSTSTAGPFTVTYPNAGNIKWKVGEYQTILWDVANTDKAPVNCQKVNIKLSINNGNAFPITLAGGVPNNGKCCIQVPNNTTVNARIRVEAADNVFLDISNSKFTIEQATTPSFTLCPGAVIDNACLPNNYTTTVSTSGLAGFSDPITLSITGLPQGVTADFSPNPVTPGSSSTLTIQFPAAFAETSFDAVIQGSTSSANAGAGLSLTTINNDFSAFAAISPINGAGGINSQPFLTWSTVPDADAYDVELANNPSFSAASLLFSAHDLTTNNIQVLSGLEEGKVYYWRVRAKNGCGPQPWEKVEAFVVAIQSCATRDATDLPKTISANGTPTVESTINISGGGAVSDVNVTKIQGSHTFFKDLEVHLIGPSGTDVLLWKDKCAYNGQFNLGMDDGATGPFTCPPPNNGSVYKPVGLLSSFNGQNSAGAWILRVKDVSQSSGGSLSGFSLQLCSNVALDPPAITTNNPLVLPSGANAGIGDNLLKVTDPNNGPQDLKFTIMELPAYGQLQIFGLAAQPGSQFTQADISNGALRYYDYNLQHGSDSFRFSVTDGSGGLIAGDFLIQATVGAREPAVGAQFDLAPNPASQEVVLSLPQPLSEAGFVTVFNAAGQKAAEWYLPVGASSLRMDTGRLPRGFYAVSLESNGGKTVKKLVLQ